MGKSKEEAAIHPKSTPPPYEAGQPVSGAALLKMSQMAEKEKQENRRPLAQQEEVNNIYQVVKARLASENFGKELIGAANHGDKELLLYSTSVQTRRWTDPSCGIFDKTYDRRGAKPTLDEKETIYNLALEKLNEDPQITIPGDTYLRVNSKIDISHRYEEAEYCGDSDESGNNVSVNVYLMLSWGPEQAEKSKKGCSIM